MSKNPSKSNEIDAANHELRKKNCSGQNFSNIQNVSKNSEFFKKLISCAARLLERLEYWLLTKR